MVSFQISVMRRLNKEYLSASKLEKSCSKRISKGNCSSMILLNGNPLMSLVRGFLGNNKEENTYNICYRTTRIEDA